MIEQTELYWNDIHLRYVMGFTEEDLDTNREGNLSSDQHFKVRYWQLRDDSVKQISGLVKKSPGKFYQVSCGNLLIHVSPQARYALIDGEDYCLHYVVSHKSILSDNILVAAEYLGTPLSDDYPNQMLRQAFQLSEKDLDANRLGSPSQTKQMRQSNFSQLFSTGLTLTLLIIAMEVFRIRDTSRGWEFAQVMCAFSLIGTLGFMLIAVYFSAASLKARRRDDVDSITGYIEFTKGNSPDLVVNGTRSFQLGEKVWSFIPGEVYTVYYVPYDMPFLNQKVLSAEHHLSHQE